MSRIVISGYYGFGNAGDEAMLDAILEALGDVIPKAEIIVISGNPIVTMEKHGVKAIHRLALKQIYGALKNCHLLISGGGSLLQDVTSDRSLYYYLTIIRMATMLNKPVMLYAQGIGPIRRKMAKIAVSQVLNKVDLIAVRDEGSHAELTRLGVNTPRIVTTADAVLGMHPVSTEVGRRLLEEHKLTGVKTRVGVSVRAWKECTAYRQVMASTLDILQNEDDCEVIFLPMQHPDDTAEARKISEMMETKAVLLDKGYTTSELLSLVGCVDVLIGVRLHALIFAALMEKPLVGISYDPKIQHFLAMIGQEAVGTLDSLEKDTLLETARAAIAQKVLKAETVKLLTALRENSLENARLAVSLLEKNNPFI